MLQFVERAMLNYGRHDNNLRNLICMERRKSCLRLHFSSHLEIVEKTPQPHEMWAHVKRFSVRVLIELLFLLICIEAFARVSISDYEYITIYKLFAYLSALFSIVFQHGVFWIWSYNGNLLFWSWASTSGDSTNMLICDYMWNQLFSIPIHKLPQTKWFSLSCIKTQIIIS